MSERILASLYDARLDDTQMQEVLTTRRTRVAPVKRGFLYALVGSGAVPTRPRRPRIRGTFSPSTRRSRTSRASSSKRPGARTRLILGLLILGLLGATPAEAQRFSCGGNRIHWVGGAPGASFDPTVVRRHQDGQQPTIPEPAGMNRELWEALVFDAWERPYPAEQTIVLDRATVPTLRICIQSPDTSYTGQRLVPFSDASWWRRHIMYWTGLSWNGEIQIAACTDEPQEGWIHVREGRPDEGPSSALAYTDSRRERHPHGAGRWLWSEIVWNPDLPNYVPPVDESNFEGVLAHELGHVFGFWHAPGGGFLGGGAAGEESSLAQLAYRVGPNVRYPGLVRTGAEVDPDPASPDRAALMALYDATNGHTWTDSTNWGTGEPLDHWHGVTIGDAGRVVRLDLHANNLTGPIPPALGTLTNLEFLRLNENNLTGPIPPALGTLTNLKFLELHATNLTGPIPPALGDLSRLEVLQLGYTNLTGPIPPALGDLSRLEVLQLGYTNLTGPIPPELGTLTNLTFLRLNENNLTGPIPPALGDLSRLESLQLAYNNLTGPLPLSLTNLRRLEDLSIENNAGLCASADAAFQAWLATVDYFTGDTCADGVPPTVPDEDPHDRAVLMALYDATNGNTWINSTNWGTDEPFHRWYGVTTDGAGRVVWLDLNHNNLTGPIPPAVGTLTNLEVLRLQFNNLTGPIPPALGTLTNLEVLELYNNNLTGPIPPELGNLTNLTYLWVTYNNLTGPLPSSMTNLGRLEYLGIGNNAGLCAPADAAFQAWLATLIEFTGDTCATVAPATPPLAQWLLALLLLGGGAYYSVRQARHSAR